MKRVMLSVLAVGLMLSAKAQVFKESLGVVSANTSVADHQNAKGFANSATLKFSGSAELQTNGSSLNKYTAGKDPASGGANLRFANVEGTDFVISGINTSGINAPVLGFGLLKNSMASNGSELAVEYSADKGKTWVGVKFPPLATGEGTGLVYQYRVTSVLPKTANLSIRFRQTSNSVVFRLDDISVSASE